MFVHTFWGGFGTRISFYLCNSGHIPVEAIERERESVARKGGLEKWRRRGGGIEVDLLL